MAKNYTVRKNNYLIYNDIYVVIIKRKNANPTYKQK